MLKGRIALWILAACSAPAWAAEPIPDAPIMLWNTFSTSSTKAEVEAFKASKPRRRVELYPGCIAEMGYRLRRGRLVSILFLGQDRDANCFERMFADLRREHGAPEIGSTTFGSGFAFGTGTAVTMVDTTSPGTVFIWRDGEKKTKFVKSPGNGYNLIFTVRPDKYIH